MRLKFVCVILTFMIFSGCREKVTIQFTQDSESRMVKFSANPEWEMEWSDRIVYNLESGSIRGHSENNVPISPDSIKSKRELVWHSAFEDEPAVVFEFPPAQLVGELPDDELEYLNLLFFNQETGFYQFYSRVLINDLERLIGKPFRFVEVPANTAFEI